MLEIKKIKLLNKIIKIQIAIDRANRKIEKIHGKRLEIYKKYWDFKIVDFTNENKAKEYYTLLHKANFLKSKAGDLSVICGKLQTKLIEAGAIDVL